MIKTALVKIFTPDKPVRITATVNRRISSGRYELTDAAGSIIIADSIDVYPPRAQVIVQGGQIIAMAVPAKPIKIYEV